MSNIVKGSHWSSYVAHNSHRGFVGIQYGVLYSSDIRVSKLVDGSPNIYGYPI